MTIREYREESGTNRKWLALWVAVLLNLVMFVGCGQADGTENLDETSVDGVEATNNEKLEELELTEDTEKAQEEAIPVVTEVVYDFDSYDEVAAVPSVRHMKREPVKGIYISSHIAGSTTRMDELIKLADETEINAFVIDVKTDDGHVSFEVDIPEVNEINSDRKNIRDIEGLMDKLYAHDIFPIARIVTFKDDYLASNKTEYAIKNKDGSLFTYKGIHWLNPYNRDSWDYIVSIAKEAANVGFKEIQFDYIRFEATSSLNNADFGGHDNVSRQEVILEFVDYAMAELEPYGVEVTADVFGIVINSERDANTIGQDYVEMSKRLDAICPMVYPSHYGYGFYGTPNGQHSDLYPYKIIYGSMEDSNEELAVIPEGEHVATVRPWLQAFTASYLGAGNYMVYGPDAIRAQIQATYDAGLEEWLLWHAGVRYNQNALLPAESEEVKQ